MSGKVIEKNIRCEAEATPTWEDWQRNENKDPYNILVENNRVYKLGGWEFLDIANKLFDNEKQVDWGSYAYQCTKEQLEKLMEQTGCEIDKMNELASEKIYGIVFVEEV